jgi:hypothetical protein
VTNIYAVTNIELPAKADKTYTSEQSVKPFTKITPFINVANVQTKGA